MDIGVNGVETLLSGFLGAIIGSVIGFFGSIWIYFHSQKSRYKLELMEILYSIEYEIRFGKTNETVFNLFNKKYLSLQSSYYALLHFSPFNKSHLRKHWRDFKGQSLESYHAGSDAFFLPDTKEEGLKRITLFRERLSL